MIGVWGIVDVLDYVGLCLLPFGKDTILQASLLVDEVVASDVGTDADASLVVFVRRKPISDAHAEKGCVFLLCERHMDVCKQRDEGVGSTANDLGTIADATP